MANKNINNLATKDDIDDIKDVVLDKKLYELEREIISRRLREKSKLKDALILVMGILRKGKWPTKEEIESLRFLEQELSV